MHLFHKWSEWHMGTGIKVAFMDGDPVLAPVETLIRECLKDGCEAIEVWDD